MRARAVAVVISGSVRRLMALAPVLLSLGLVACSSHRSGEVRRTAEVDAAAFAPPSELAASLASQSNVDLRWRNNATAPSVSVVEFKFPHDNELTLLDFLRADATSYRHPDLAPEMTYCYQVRSYFGHTSAAVAVVTPSPVPKGSPIHDEFGEEGPLSLVDPTWRRKRAEPPATGKVSIRTTLTAAKGVPNDVTATLSSPISVDLEWTDRVADEDGYLVELSGDPAGAFAIVALLPPNAESFRKTQLPPNTKCFFRVRPFFRGRPSAQASLTTPKAAD